MVLKMKSGLSGLCGDIFGWGLWVTNQWRVVFGRGASNGIRIRPPQSIFFTPYSDSHDMPLDFLC